MAKKFEVTFTAVDGSGRSFFLQDAESESEAVELARKELKCNEPAEAHEVVLGVCKFWGIETYIRTDGKHGIGWPFSSAL